ncbi:hypothetical protein TWF106_010314 [Orbilia oligospora]|uniref:Uncharacterized protein n=1 Tax=Orbilia oligospora TaxID=2813651 RepID=A0A7C8UJ52_ORBOL|nr:hypothetical protein TWF106_010314 [Orbilia oligospora]
MANVRDGDSLLETESKRQENQLLHLAPLTVSGLGRVPLYPEDSISETDATLIPSRCSSPSKNLTSTVGPKLQKREMLDRSFPRFDFLSVSGRGGLSADEDSEDRVPASLQRLVRYLRGAPCLDSMVCSCVEGMIQEQWPDEPWPRSNIPKRECNNPRRHSQEAGFVIEISTVAERHHSEMTEKTAYVSTTARILESVAGFAKQFHPVSAAILTSVHVNQRLFPVVKNVPTQDHSISLSKAGVDASEASKQGTSRTARRREKAANSLSDEVQDFANRFKRFKQRITTVIAERFSTGEKIGIMEALSIWIEAVVGKYREFYKIGYLVE